MTTRTVARYFFLSGFVLAWIGAGSIGALIIWVLVADSVIGLTFGTALNPLLKDADFMVPMILTLGSILGIAGAASTSYRTTFHLACIVIGALVFVTGLILGSAYLSRSRQVTGAPFAGLAALSEALVGLHLVGLALLGFCAFLIGCFGKLMKRVTNADPRPHRAPGTVS